MTEKTPKSVGPTQENPDNSPFDRQAYFKEIRSGLLKKLGLPEDTRPEKVERLLGIREALDKAKAGNSH
ncbi:MAG: hypothetical protein LBS31_11305 [Candidatus Adiutrix sp.]|jgi:hypothetical protein|nr:hypothetical protein [Candidatus Adiutrix sp.]